MLQSPISPDTVVVACKDQVSREVDGEIVILHAKSGVYFGLNPVGADIWAWIQEPATVADVREKLLQKYEDVEADACTEVLLDFLKQMTNDGLVEVLAPNHA